MSQLFVDDVVSKEGTNSVGFSKGISVSVASTFSGDVSIGGTLTYEDVTNIDAVGLITARNGLKIGAAGIGGTIAANGNTTLAGIVTCDRVRAQGGVELGVAGVGGTITAAGNAILAGIVTCDRVTAQGGVEFGVAGVGGTITAVGNAEFAGIATVGTGLTLADNVHARFGNAGDLQIYHDSSNSYIKDAGTGNLYIFSENLRIENADGSKSYIEANNGGSTELYFDGTKKFETTNNGTVTTGIATVTVGTDLDGYKVEEGSYDTNALNGEFDFELENGHVQTHTGSTGGTYFPDFRVSSSQSLSSVMDVGDVISATLIVAASNTSHYCTTGIKIDNSTSNVTIEWIGSSAPSAGKGAGYDVYSFTIQKTAATPAYLVIVNATDAG